MRKSRVRELLDRLAAGVRLTWPQWRTLLARADAADRQYAMQLARHVSRSQFGREVFLRGIVEISSHCRNNCLYCGIRRGNVRLLRYRMEAAQVMRCCAAGYAQGLRTFVLQSGEDPQLTDAQLVPLLEGLSSAFPDAAITLSLGERSAESYRRLYAAGARRYLLRHESANARHYRRLHSPGQQYWQRLECLHTLRDLGYQTGCGLMVGSPWQTAETLADDMTFMQNFKPQMIGLGPFLPHHATPLRHFPAGSAELTLFLLALCRLMAPRVLLPATTSLRSLLPDGLTRGLEVGCNVVMPNLTPAVQGLGYTLYDGKLAAGGLRESLENIRAELRAAGYVCAEGRGDWTAGRGTATAVPVAPAGS